MLPWWTQLLPVFLFKRLARRFGNICRFREGAAWVKARPDVWVRFDGVVFLPSPIKTQSQLP